MTCLRNIWVWVAISSLPACIKENPGVNRAAAQLYPLQMGNTWVYVDSFYDDTGNYIGLDTFALKPGIAVQRNGMFYTPITDRYDDSIFIVRSGDSLAYIMEPPGESLLFSLPVDTFNTAKVLYYDSGRMQTIIFSKTLSNTNFPSFRIVITMDDGKWYDYEQRTFFFTPYLGIIKGSNAWKNAIGKIYISDSYQLTSFTVH
jgi:hypothetical protein